MNSFTHTFFIDLDQSVQVSSGSVQTYLSCNGLITDYFTCRQNKKTFFIWLHSIDRTQLVVMKFKKEKYADRLLLFLLFTELGNFYIVRIAINHIYIYMNYN